ncbi:acyl-CoA dehydrogenase domain-containing protein [Colletotrichum scovillei]|uniref:Acyl-CoA dehydrogenase domain-containing protein n=1 Tax=Colletotrichum scovillei TaxID=1209932 RepID=A0A9P7RG46_9PEZI|nr:acyl-CoA dehydrogenase domain-containing protein [Colletotrichum scovillei]
MSIKVKNVPVVEPYGNPAPFAEPAWYNTLASPYYDESHRMVRDYVRKYIEENIAPNIQEWEEKGHVPDEARVHFAKSGLAFPELPRQYAGDVPLPGNVPAEKWDIFHSLVVSYEASRIWAAGVSVGLNGGTTIGVPPVIHHGTEEQKRWWLPGLITGKTSFCLGCTEPTGGSDLANLKTTAIRSDDGTYYTVNGHKKWISGAIRASHMTTAVRTGGPGIKGISVLVIPLDLPGVSRRKISNSGWNAGDSTWVTLDNVKVPANHLIGQENAGFQYIMTNFNKERFILAVLMNGQARICLEDAWAYAIDRHTFGKPLMYHQIIRHKLITMARYIESHWAWLEQIAYHAHTTGSMGTELASRIAMAKIHGGRLLELANRDAQQIFGGAGYQRGGVGARVEQISRDLRVNIVGGGSEEIITDLAVRQEIGAAHCPCHLQPLHFAFYAIDKQHSGKLFVSSFNNYHTRQTHHRIDPARKMEQAVRDFKTLGRSKTTPSGLDNKWVFGVRHVDLNPPGDLVIAVHPKSRFLLQGGPAQILSQPTEQDRARATVTPLLQAFFKGSPGAEHAAFAPWSWSTDSSELAAAIAPELAAAGILGGLEKVTVCTAEEKEILGETWSEVRDLMMNFMGARRPRTATTAPSAVSPGNSSKCHGCGLSSENFPSPMKKCSACQKAWYHSQDCQRSHWKTHKPTCVAHRPVPAPSTATSSGMGPAYNYYNIVARKSEEGQALLRSLNIDPVSVRPGMDLPLRRLVIAGKDTPEYLRILFGPTFASEKKELERVRLEVLVDPPRGSPMYVRQELDDAGTKPPTRALRPASEAELETLKAVREIQDKVRQKVGVGRSPDTRVMQEVLMTFGPDWSEKLQLYMLAVNTMDQGVRR